MDLGCMSSARRLCPSSLYTIGPPLQNASSGLTSGTLEWSPVIDGVDVVGDPRQLAAAGKASNVPVMFGTNRNEGTIFSTCPHDLPNASYVSWMEER